MRGSRETSRSAASVGSCTPARPLALVAPPSLGQRLGSALGSTCRPGARGGFSLLVVTDVGPDPDDAKALLIAATLHKQKLLTLRGVIANGGRQARARARLARCLLDHVSCGDVPVGVGSAGRPHAARPYEYTLPGYGDEGADARLVDGARLFAEVLKQVPPRSLRVVLISSLRDFADVIGAHAELVLAKVHTVAVQGGLLPAGGGGSGGRGCSAGGAAGAGGDGAGGDGGADGWEPDTSVNNMFDMEAARAVYAFCFEKGLLMTVTSRNAVPMLPMQLARSFAERTKCPVMRYLAEAQFLGLQGLWQQLCARTLPPRCTKQWFFETFCGVGAAEFGARRLGASLDHTTAIVGHLNGFVKPYDVLALMTVLPQTAGLFRALPGALVSVRGVEHLLLLERRHAVDVKHVLNLLRETYHEVTFATRARAAALAGGSARCLLSGDAALGGCGGGGKGAASVRASLRASFKLLGTSDSAAFAARGRRLARSSSSSDLEADGADGAAGGAEAAAAESGGGGGASAAAEAAGAGSSGSSGALAAAEAADGAANDGCADGAGGSVRVRVRVRGARAPRFHAAVLSSAEIEAMLDEAITAARLQQRVAAITVVAVGSTLLLAAIVGAIADGVYEAWAQSDLAHARTAADAAQALFAAREEGGGAGGDRELLEARVDVVYRAMLLEGPVSRNGSYLCGLLVAMTCSCLLLGTAQAQRARLRASAALLSLIWLLYIVVIALRSAEQHAAEPGVSDSYQSAMQALYASASASSAAAGLGGSGVRAQARVRLGIDVATIALVGGGALVVLALALAPSADGAAVAGARCGPWRAAHVRAATLYRCVWLHQSTAALVAGLLRLEPLARAASVGMLSLWPLPYLATRLATGAALVALGAIFLWPPARDAIRIFAARTCVARGTDASLAPLLGFGSRRGECEADVLTAEAQRSFRAFTLDAAARRELARGGLLDIHARLVPPASRARRSSGDVVLAGGGGGGGADGGGGGGGCTEDGALAGEAWRLEGYEGEGKVGTGGSWRLRRGRQWSKSPASIRRASPEWVPPFAAQCAHAAQLALRRARNSTENVTLCEELSATWGLGGSGAGGSQASAAATAVARITPVSDAGGSAAGTPGGGGGAAGGSLGSEDGDACGRAAQRAPRARAGGRAGTESAAGAGAESGDGPDLSGLHVSDLLDLPPIFGCVSAPELGRSEAGAWERAATGASGAAIRATGSGDSGASGSGSGARSPELAELSSRAQGQRAWSRPWLREHAPARPTHSTLSSTPALSARTLSPPPPIGRSAALAAPLRRVRASAEARLGARAVVGAPAPPAPLPTEAAHAFADAYVVHSFDDDAKDRAAALCAWAEAFERRHRRPPTVWLNQLCADMSLSTVQLLAHLPIYQSMCHRLLLLAGPTLPERLWCVIECYVWSAMGGRPEDVDVEVAAKDAASCQDIVAAFDAFHVINAVGTSPAVTDRIQRAVELATVANFNARVRDFLPPVHEAGVRFGSRQAQALGGGASPLVGRRAHGCLPAPADDGGAADGGGGAGGGAAAKWRADARQQEEGASGSGGLRASRCGGLAADEPGPGGSSAGAWAPPPAESEAEDAVSGGDGAGSAADEGPGA